jgi:hypothetical protein
MAARMVAVLAALVALAAGSANDAYAGWRMVDRFSAFRFEVAGAFRRPRMVKAIVDKADELSVFGWVQVPQRTGTVVGEVRGTIATARAMEAHLRALAGPEGAATLAVRPYADTRIRLLFSTFRVLDPSRMTCFEEAPHACTPDEEEVMREL